METELRSSFAVEQHAVIYSQIAVVPELSVELGDGWKVNAIVRAHMESDDRLEPGRPSQETRSVINRRLLIGDRAEVDLRELYLVGSTGPVFWTAGKQQIVWGKADRIRVLDIVNPHSFREFILRDFEHSRIPLWSVKGEVAIGPLQIEGVFIPDRTYADLPGAGSAFELTARRFRPPAGATGSVVTFQPAVGRREGFDYGGRLSGFAGGWDFSLLYFRHTEDAPIFNVSDLAGETSITPVFNRAHLIGGSASNAFGDFTVRAEIGALIDRGISSVGVLAQREPTQANSVSYVVGVDWYGLENTLISVQVFQDRILGANPVAIPKNDTFITGALRRTFGNERFRVNLRGLQNLIDDDALVQFSVDYQIRDSVALFAGGEVFIGQRDGVFGQFKDASRMQIGVRLGL